MKTERFQDLYLQIGETVKFEASEEQVRTSLRLASFEFEDLVELSYRDPMAFAVAMAYRGYVQILSYGGSDNDGFVDFGQLQELVRKQTDKFLDERSEFALERMQQHDEQQLRDMATPV